MRTALLMMGRLIMAAILCGILLLCVSLHQVRSGAPAADPLTILVHELPYWSDHEVLGPAVREVQGRLDLYLRCRSQAEAVAGRDTMQFHVIGQTHMPPNIIPIGRAEILTSQYNVYTLLSKQRPGAICLEGWYRDIITAKQELGRRKGRERENLLAEKGAIRFLDESPTPAFGAEDSSLHQLQLQIIDYNPSIQDIGPAAYRELDRLMLTVLDARSQVAVDRSVLGWHRLRRPQTVLVIGADHRRGCLIEAQRLHLRVRFTRANTYILLKK